MTVSRALSGQPNVNPQTRDQILAHAAAVGYVKSHAAATLRGDGSRIIGLLVPNIVNEFYARFADSLSHQCADLDLDLVIHLTDDHPTREAEAIGRLAALQASTVIIVPTPGSTLATVKPAAMQVVPVIRTLGASWADANALLVDDRPALAEAVAHLVAKGVQRIAYIGASDTLSSGRARLAAVQTAMAEAGLTPQPDLMVTGAPGYGFGVTGMARLLDRADRPGGVICGGFEISNGALEGVLTAGLSLPADMRFVGYGDPGFYRWVAGGVSTISLSAEALATRAMDLLGGQSAGAGQVSARLILRATA